MAATVDVVEGNGASVLWTVVTTPRFCTADSNAPGTDNSIVISASGLNYSYWKTLALKLSGSFTMINNIKWYTDGTVAWTMGTGGKVVVGVRDSDDNGCPVASYERSAGTEGTTGYYMDDVSNGHNYYKDQTATPADVTDYTSGAVLDVDSTDYTTTTAATKAVITQVILDDDATRGAQAAETFTFRYDEI